MATRNMIFEVVRECTERELRRVRKMKYEDVYWHADYFSVTKTSYERHPEVYEAVMSLCTPAETVDGVEIFVAHKKVLVVGSNEFRYQSMKSTYQFEDEVYYDVTKLFGGRAVNIDSINWADRTSKTLVKIKSYKFSRYRKCRLIYMQG